MTLLNMYGYTLSPDDMADGYPAPDNEFPRGENSGPFRTWSVGSGFTLYQALDGDRHWWIGACLQDGGEPRSEFYRVDQAQVAAMMRHVRELRRITLDIRAAGKVAA